MGLTLRRRLPALGGQLAGHPIQGLGISRGFELTPGHQVEDQDLAVLPVFIDARHFTMPGVVEGPQVPDGLPLPQGLKQVKLLPIGGVVADGAIATLHGHVALLPLAGEGVHSPVRRPGIHIAELVAGFPREQEDGGHTLRRADSTSHLPTKGLVDVLAAVVELADLEIQRGRWLQPNVEPTIPKNSEARGILTTGKVVMGEHPTQGVLAGEAQNRFGRITAPLVDQVIVRGVREIVRHLRIKVLHRPFKVRPGDDIEVLRGDALRLGNDM